MVMFYAQLCILSPNCRSAPPSSQTGIAYLSLAGIPRSPDIPVYQFLIFVRITFDKAYLLEDLQELKRI